ncbi:hypothetical protein BRADI_1g78718v3 [Brachypodium distachyon]|uniref:Uncharacterized protein n=1 Tax=Brachypodium distachyon TaxID=15368 RepID=A0A2K2DVV5_BRADI|nr:hypothetical protein BRADI_1g78718v3 [Brachypodium distachyon]
MILHVNGDQTLPHKQLFVFCPNFYLHIRQRGVLLQSYARKEINTELPWFLCSHHSYLRISLISATIIYMTCFMFIYMYLISLYVYW